MEYLKFLNQSQYEAVTTTAGPLLVIAGAGSGKTRVIEYRTLYLVQHGVDPKEILLLTFTRRAASQMLKRAGEKDPRCEHVQGGTFHSFGYRTLKNHGRVLGIPAGFSLLDESDIESILQKLASQMGYYDRQQKFPKKDTLKNIISSGINKGKSILEILESEYPSFVSFADEISDIAARYAKHKSEAGYLDYDDLLVHLLTLLKDAELRRVIASRYKHIMVDEYQDTNGLQAAIVALLGADHKNVMVVGDDAQSIYRFRGALHQNIIKFPELFPGAKIVKLEDNYRSTQAILNLANSILDNMESKFRKVLRAAAGESGNQPLLQSFDDSFHEAEWITEVVKDLLKGGASPNSIAVLYRSSFISLPVQAELSKLNIPFQVFGGLKFYEMAHVKDVMAFLRVLINYRDFVSWIRLLQLLPGVGQKTAERVAELLMGCESYEEASNILTTLNEPRFRSGAKVLSQLLLVCRAASSVKDQFNSVIKFYIPFLRDRYDDHVERLQDLEVLSQMAKRYESLQDLVADFTLDTPIKRENAMDLPGSDTQGVITLSTIHSAKGLEWETVFLIGLSDGILPARRSLTDTAEIEEERRLFYVAVTRAKKQLFMSYAMDSGGKNSYEVKRLSRFLLEPKVISSISGLDLVPADDDSSLKRHHEKADDDLIYDYDDAVSRFRW